MKPWRLGAPIPPIMREAPEPVPVWREYAEAGADGGEQGQQQQQQEAAAQPPLGSAAARQWLAAIARHCEGTEGAQAKAALNELLRCGSRARDKVVTVTNRIRQAIGTVFRCGAGRRRRALAATPPAWLGLSGGARPPTIRLKSHGHTAAADMCMCTVHVHPAAPRHHDGPLPPHLPPATRHTLLAALLLAAAAGPTMPRTRLAQTTLPGRASACTCLSGKRVSGNRQSAASAELVCGCSIA